MSTMAMFDTPERISLPGADVLLWPRVDIAPDPDRCLRALIDETPWRQDTVTLWGKEHLQPRLTAWYGDPGRKYRYSGIEMSPLPWTSLLSTLKIQVEGLCGVRFNSVLLNYYRDQRDSMGLHSDDEPELGRNPVIASLSLGEQRVLTFKHRRDKGHAAVKLPLPNGSLLLMQGKTQHNWKHGINKLTRDCGPRINLTFRTIRD